MKLNGDRVVFIDVFVGSSFDFQQIFPGNGGVEINGYEVRAQVKAHIITLILLTDHPAADVFAGVLLHVIKAPRPVDLPGDGANLHRAVGGVENNVVFLVDIQHPGRTQNAMICRLSAALRIKGGAV